MKKNTSHIFFHFFHSYFSFFSFFFFFFSFSFFTSSFWVSYFYSSSNVFSFIWRNSYLFNEIKKSAGNANPSCFKSVECLLGPVGVMCSLLLFLRKKNVSFVKDFGTCSTVFFVVYNCDGAFIFYKKSRSCFWDSGESRSNFRIPLHLVSMVSLDITSNIEFLFEKNRNF